MHKLKLCLWLMWRHLTFAHRYLSMSMVVSICGMMFGVSALIVAMAIVSGYETTLKKSIIDSFGHVAVSFGDESVMYTPEFQEKIKSVGPEVVSHTPYLLVAGILAYQGKVKGVFLEGLDSSSHFQTLNLKKHITEGELLLTGGEILGAVVGKGLVKKLALKLGDELKVVVPVGGLDTQAAAERLRSKVFRLRVEGVIDLGRHDFDERYILVDLERLQEVSGLNERVTGVRVRTVNADLAPRVAQSLESALGYGFSATTWWDSSRSIFKAIEYERPVIFIVVMLIAVAAVFNISAALFVSVFRRYRELSVLRAMGATRGFIMGVFSLQGMAMGFIGGVLGIFLGLGICEFLIWLQDKVQLFPGEVYRIDHVALEIRMSDLLTIAGACMLICFLATLAPARRGSRIKIVEGLRYE